MTGWRIGPRIGCMAAAAETRVVHAVCSHDCPDSCGVLVTVESLTNGDHPSNRRLPGTPIDHPSNRRLPGTPMDGAVRERAVKIEGDPAHPVTQGFLCGKVAQYLERVYSPERLLYPMRRKPGRSKGPAGYGGVKGREADAFERIPWDEALGLIAERVETNATEDRESTQLKFRHLGNS